MAIVSQKVKFKTPAPSLQRITDTITGICGLPVTAEESSAEIKGSLFDLHASLAFPAYPKDKLQIHTYIPGIVQKHHQEMMKELGGFAPPAQGWDEGPEFQTVYLIIYLGQEPTLFEVAGLALEKLGGILDHPIPEETRKTYDTKLALGTLKKRHFKSTAQGLLMMFILLIALPITVPLTLLRAALTRPGRIKKALQLMREKGDLKKP
jgi:hypothetical protein